MTGISAPARPAVRALTTALAALVLLLLGAGTASAHAALLSTDPAAGAVLPVQPAAVTLTFGEGVTLPAEALRVLDPAGRRVDSGAPAHAGGRTDTLRVALRPHLADGTYTVAWQVISADTHPVGGAFTFSIGARSASTVSVSALEHPRTDPVIAFLYGTGRGVGYAAFAVLAGAVVFVLGCWPAGAGVAQVQKLLAVGWIGLLGSTLVQMLLRGPYEQGSGIDPSADPVVAHAHVPLDERIYLALGARLALLVAGAVFLVLLVAQSGRPEDEAPAGAVPDGAARAAADAVAADTGPDGAVQAAAHTVAEGRSRRRLGMAGLLLAVGLAATWVVTDHASQGIQVWAALPVTTLHLLAMAAWLGGLVTLVVALRHGIDATSARRFSTLAFLSVTVLVLTGAYQAWREVGAWSELTGTGYGRLLLVKVGCVAVVLAAAWFSRRGLARWYGAAREEGGEAARRGLRRSVLAESAVAVVVLVVTTLLTASAPARNSTIRPRAGAAPAAGRATAAPRTLTLPFDTGGGTANARGTAVVTFSPAASGGDAVQVRLTGADGRPVAEPEVDLALTLPEKRLGPLTASLRSQGGGLWSGSVALTFAGRWTVALSVRSSAIDEATSTGRLTLG